jgi:hypothetical protein
MPFATRPHERCADQLKHFQPHGPGWKLAALLICRLHVILPAAAGFISVCGILWWVR